MFLAGIDGGGTSTRAALLDWNSGRWGYGLAGPSNYDDLGYEAARANIDLAMATAWAKLGMPRQPVAAIFLGMAGVVAPMDRANISAMACELGLAAPDAVHVDHDIRVAHAGALAGRAGLVLIAGTGSSGYGRSNGESWRAGGWGGLIDDGGGAYQLGRQALAAVVQAYDGRGTPTGLTAPVLAKLGITDIEAIMHRLYVTGISRSEIAAFARLVTAAAATDPVCYRLLAAGAEDLASMADAIALKLSFSDQAPLIAVTGSLVSQDPLYKDLVYAALARRLPRATIVEPELPSVAGAVLLAGEQVLTSAEDKTTLLARVRGSAPDFPRSSTQQAKDLSHE